MRIITNGILSARAMGGPKRNPRVKAGDVRRPGLSLRPVPLDEEIDDELEHRRILGDAGDVVEGRDVVRGVLRAVPRQGLGDPLDLVVGLVEAEVLAPERDDGGEIGGHLAANRVPFAEVVVVGGVGVAAVLVSDRRVDRLATFTLEPGAAAKRAEPGK